jgi:nicotinamidase-related amidase
MSGAEFAASVGWNTLRHVWDDVADPDMRTIYRAYHRALGLKGRVAVIAVDLYNKAFEGGPLPPSELQETYPSSCGKYAHAAVDPIARVFAAARRIATPVIHVTANAASGSITATNRRVGGLDPAGPAGQWDFHPALAPAPDELVVVKERASAFYGTQLVAELVTRGISTVLVVGESTSGCVRATVVDACSNGFHTAVVEDGVFDRSWLNHQVNLFDLHHKYADVMDSATVIGLLERLPAAAPR